MNANTTHEYATLSIRRSAVIVGASTDKTWRSKKLNPQARNSAVPINQRNAGSRMISCCLGLLPRDHDFTGEPLRYQALAVVLARVGERVLVVIAEIIQAHDDPAVILREEMQRGVLQARYNQPALDERILRDRLHTGDFAALLLVQQASHLFVPGARRRISAVSTFDPGLGPDQQRCAMWKAKPDLSRRGRRIKRQIVGVPAPGNENQRRACLGQRLGHANRIAELGEH